MPANTSPIFTLNPRISNVRLTAANTSSAGDGTIGTNIFLAFTPGSNGSYIQKVRFSLGESTIATASTAAVHRLFVSTVNSGSTTSSNTFLLAEVNAAAQTPTSTAAGYVIEVPLNFALPATYYILASTSLAPATNTFWNSIVIGGDY